MEYSKFAEFLKIAGKLNEIEITPLLMGSVGLEVLTGKSWEAQDLDIHVPGDERGWKVPPEVSIDQWEGIVEIMDKMGYTLIDLHEHEFFKEGGFSVEFGIIDTLPGFAGVELQDLELQKTGKVEYYLLNPEQYLSVYKASSVDSYRADKNHNKDTAKINFLHSLI